MMTNAMGSAGGTLDSLYPQARKLQFELKMQMSYLDSGRSGGKTDDELQAEARGNLSQLQQLLWQLDSLVQVHARPAERDNWTKYVESGEGRASSGVHIARSHPSCSQEAEPAPQRDASTRPLAGAAHLPREPPRR